MLQQAIPTQEGLSKGVHLWCFVAPYCDNSRKLLPKLEQLSSEFPEIKFWQVDPDLNEYYANKYNITAVPTLLVFQEGKLVKTILGFQLIKPLRTLLKSLI